MNIWSLPARSWLAAGLAGVVVGVIYALSPLTICFALAMWLLVFYARRGLGREERQWVTAVLAIAIVLRIAIIAGLFLLTDHAKVPFGTFFGDEELYIRRSLWLRNVALDLPVHGADLIYAYDDLGATSHLYVLAFLQIFFGPAPYGVHLLGVAFYLFAATMLYRIVRKGFGRVPALAGLIVLLALPSLFAWSLSALKEPLFFLLTAFSVVLTQIAVRGQGWRARIGAAIAVAAIVWVQQSVREAGAFLCGAGVVGGLVVAFLLARPRLLLATVVAAPIMAGAILSRPAMQIDVYAAVQSAAKQHWGHVATLGYVYHALDDRFYPDKSEIGDMHFDEGLRFLVRSFWNYVTAPLPWEVQSPIALAYLPEQVVWYIIVLLLPIGAMLAFRRDLLLASLLFAQAAVAAITVAVTSGNVGTLVRHRGLALPYMVWLSAVGGCELLVWLHRRFAAAASVPDHRFVRIESTCP